MCDILALATRYGGLTRGLAYAGELATAMQGSLTGLFVSEPVTTSGFQKPYPEFLTLASDVAREASDAAPTFERWAAKLGLRHHRWQVAQGRVEPVLARLANWHDILVLESADDIALGSAPVLGKVLLIAGITCIVVPKGSRDAAIPESVAIAWNGAPESMRAVRSALPLLARAKRVLLIDGEGGVPYSSVAWEPSLGIERYLSEHGIAFERRRFEASTIDAGRGLLEAARSVSANLIVMGAYGHSRFGEWVFGGATEFVLGNTEIPVLFRH